MGQVGEYVASAAKMGLGLSELMLKDVTPAMFARKPAFNGKVIDTNHPAFVFGHLSSYPSRGLVMCGLDAAHLAAPASFDDLFAAGKECKDDPSGTIYPAMHVITDVYFKAYRGAIELLPSVPDAILTQPNPREQARSRLPTLGAVLVFYFSSHPMMHLGQVSTWRRCFGLGSAMT